MKKKELLKRIEELEKQVVELQAAVAILKSYAERPITYPMYPAYPSGTTPWKPSDPPVITC